MGYDGFFGGVRIHVNFQLIDAYYIIYTIDVHDFMNVWILIFGKMFPRINLINLFFASFRGPFYIFKSFPNSSNGGSRRLRVNPPMSGAMVRFNEDLNYMQHQIVASDLMEDGGAFGDQDLIFQDGFVAFCWYSGTSTN